MQLMLILGVVFAIGAVAFALQNNVLVAVTFAVWQFEGSLALVLLLALGLGVLITGLLSSPAAIRGQWSAARLRRQVVDLEREVAEQRLRNSELVAELARLSPAVVTAEREKQKPYVGLRSLLAGESEASAADVRPSAVEKGR
jgi:uncharacterized integral membrane protein